MLGVLAEKAAGQVLNVEAVLSGVLGYEHGGEPAQFVFSRNVLHHLPDFWKTLAFARIAQILEPAASSG